MIFCRLKNCLFFLLSFASMANLSYAQRREALTPEQSQAQIVLDAGFSARTIAHEPNAIDPVEIAFDDAGRLWVVEMRDYPFRMGEAARGSIQVLRDADNDGLYETATTFADQLEMPNGLALWKNGVVATIAGKLVYLADADGDLIADSSQVWLEGFTQDNEQLRANHPRLGPDGKWYIACGLRGGDVQLGPDLRADQGSEELQVLKIGSRDVRFDLKTKRIELITGPAQFGLAFDTLGSRLFCSNRNPATQVVFEQSDLNGNPLAGIAPSVVDVIPSGDASHVYPLVEAWTTSHLHSGQFTAACGVFTRESSGLRTEVFACEPTGGLVRRQLSHLRGTLLVPDGSPDPAGKEWLASRDPWFRPVNVGLSPDGEVIVVDMHRAVIEHPRWVPEELKNRPDERWGNDSGRIIWVGQNWNLPATLKQLQDLPLAKRSDQELTGLVASHNPWLRATAARLLVEREAGAVSAALFSQAQDAELSTEARVDSLRLAMLLSAGDSDSARSGLNALLNADLEVGENFALAIVAMRLTRERPQLLKELEPSIINLLDNTKHMGLRFEACLSLGQIFAVNPAIDQPVVPLQLVENLLASWVQSGNRHFMIAVASALRNQPQLLLEAWLQTLKTSDTIAAETQGQVAEIARGLILACCQQASDLASLIEMSQQQLLEDFAQNSLAAGAQSARLATIVCLQELVKQPGVKPLIEDRLWSRLSTIVADGRTEVTCKSAAIALLGQSSREADTQLLESLVRQNQEPALAEPLLLAWSKSGSTAVNDYLFNELPRATPQMQRVMLNAIGNSNARLEILATELRSHSIDAKQIGAAELKKLIARATGKAKKDLQGQLELISNSNRAKVVDDYKACLALESDATRGIEVFRKNCASCHRIGDIGFQVGPNISDSRTKQPLELLTSILDPNLVIDNNYFRFAIVTIDGRVLDGIIAEETSDVIVLRGQDDRREVIRRSDIAEMKATGVSLMPEGVEAQIDHQSMADLIAYIKGWRYLDGAVPGR